MTQRTLYILYNADSTIFGKLRYGYRKIAGSGEESACAACDITHGGLSLSESPKWLECKKQIEAGGLKVVQWHRDEISSELLDYIKSYSIRYPAVILSDNEKKYSNVMSSQDLNACGGDPRALVEELKKKDVLSENKADASL